MCGFISIFAPDGETVVRDVLAGLLAIQHRGQDAAGIVTFRDKFHTKMGLGLVREVFEEKHLERLQGNLGVGHVRYPTVGGNEAADVQPFWLDFPTGVSMAHNGNVTNFHELKRTYFGDRNIPLGSNCDLEAVLYVFADALMERPEVTITADDIERATKSVFELVKGAYSVVGTTASGGMYAFRDPFGIKPIIFGKKVTPEGTWYAVASESVVLDVAGYSVVRNLEAGEMLWIDADRKPVFRQVGKKPHRPCIFEYIYFARPDAVIDNVSVYRARMRLGERLAESWRETGISVDAVIPVPESARTAAQTMAEALNVPYREGFVKNRYVGRTFIMPNDKERRASIRQKLNPIREEFDGKDVLIVDDSIVRGNTSRQIIRIARDMGARKVFLASYSPPLIFPCPYGVDMSTKREFVARGRTVEEVADDLGVDYLLYQTTEDMVEALHDAGAGGTKFCKACFVGEYPTGDITEEMLSAIEDDRIAAGTSEAAVPAS